jgi:hypothetical protein
MSAYGVLRLSCIILSKLEQKMSRCIDSVYRLRDNLAVVSASATGLRPMEVLPSSVVDCLVDTSASDLVDSPMVRRLHSIGLIKYYQVSDCLPLVRQPVLLDRQQMGTTDSAPEARLTICPDLERETFDLSEPTIIARSGSWYLNVPFHLHTPLGYVETSSLEISRKYRLPSTRNSLQGVRPRRDQITQTNLFQRCKPIKEKLRRICISGQTSCCH